MNNLDRFLEVQERIFPLLEDADPDSLGAARAAFISPFVELQLAFAEALYDLGSLPDAESVRTRFSDLARWFATRLLRIAQRANELDPSCDEKARAISVCIQETAVASVLLLEFEDADVLPHGLEAVFAEVRDDPLEPRNEELLRSLGIPPARLAAFFHVLDRPPRRGNVPHWKVIAERDPGGFRDKWLPASVSWCMKDFDERTCLPPIDRERGDVETLEAAGEADAEANANIEAFAASSEARKAVETLAAKAGLSPREHEVFYRHCLLRERLVDIAADLGVAPETVRTHKFRARRKLRGEQPEF
jgi:DNA-binding CsgD family transcriptional regulator